jgi:hypothetical protein
MRAPGGEQDVAIKVRTAGRINVVVSVIAALPDPRAIRARMVIVENAGATGRVCTNAIEQTAVRALAGGRRLVVAARVMERINALGAMAATIQAEITATRTNAIVQGALQ